MARGRMISQMVATDKRFNALSTEAALVFLMTVPHLDRDGLLLADAPVLAGQVCPRREELRHMMEEIIDEWIALSMVIAYECEDGTVLFFTGFAKNQVGMRYDREPKSTLPPPPGYSRTKDGLVPEKVKPPSSKIPPSNGTIPPSSGKYPASIQQPSGNLPPEENRIEEEYKNPLIVPPSEETPEAPTAHDDLGSVFICWQDNMPGTMTPILTDKIIALVDECTARSVIHGVIVAVETNKRFFSYVESVARNHSAGREPPGHKAEAQKLSDAQKSALLTRSKTAQGNIRTAETLGTYINPEWYKDIEVAKGLGLQ